MGKFYYEQLKNCHGNRAPACPHPPSGGQTVPRAGLQPPPPRADRIATLQRGRDCRAEAVKRAQKRLGQMPHRNAWAPSGPV